MKGLLGLLILTMCAIATYRRGEVWQSEKSLWLEAARVSPSIPRPRINLGMEYQKEGDYAASLREFRIAQKLARSVDWPEDHKRISRVMADSNVALLLLVHGAIEESAELSTKVLADWPNWRPALVNRGTARLAQGRCQEAFLDYLRAGVEILPRC